MPSPDVLDCGRNDNMSEKFPGVETSVNVTYEPTPTPGSPPEQVRFMENNTGAERASTPLKAVVDIYPDLSEVRG
ncbi:hypothetical protein [Pseudomonas synxantha]|nr:hypothetical protein [Pseudomonas synxantha]